MPKQKDQRVGVFVDVQNMYYSAKQFYNTKVNFAHILNRAVQGRQLIRAIAYVIKADIKDEENFFEALEKIGYDVRSKDLQTFFGGAKKGDWDVGIAMDIMRMASKLDVVVLVSGDGDFKDLLEHVKSLGCRAEVVAFRKTASSRILSETDEFIDLDKELDKVLIRSNRHPPQKRFEANKDGQREQREPREFKREFHHDRHERPHENFEHHDEASLIQKINMDQPDLVKVNKEPLLMPPKQEGQIEFKEKLEIENKGPQLPRIQDPKEQAHEQQAANARQQGPARRPRPMGRGRRPQRPSHAQRKEAPPVENKEPAKESQHAKTAPNQEQKKESVIDKMLSKVTKKKDKV